MDITINRTFDGITVDEHKAITDMLKVLRHINEAHDVVSYVMAAGTLRHYIRVHREEHERIASLVERLDQKGLWLIHTMDEPPLFAYRASKRIAEEAVKTRAKWNESVGE